MPSAAGSVQTRPGRWRTAKTRLGKLNGSHSLGTNGSTAPENYLAWKKNKVVRRFDPNCHHAAEGEHWVD